MQQLLDHLELVFLVIPIYVMWFYSYLSFLSILEACKLRHMYIAEFYDVFIIGNGKSNNPLFSFWIKLACYSMLLIFYVFPGTQVQQTLQKLWQMCRWIWSSLSGKFKLFIVVLLCLLESKITGLFRLDHVAWLILTQTIPENLVTDWDILPMLHALAFTL